VRAERARTSRRLLAALASATLALGVFAGGSPLAPGLREARATVVERIVAVVGEHAVLLSDVKHRAKPLVAQIYDRIPAGPQRSAYESEMYKDLLQQMVDERLIQMAADRAQKKVSADEVDQGLRNLSGSQNMSVEELMIAASQSGLTAQELRDQVQRQLLEQKMLSLRVVPRVRISSEDVRIGYNRLKREERKRLGYRPQWILLLVPPNASPEARAERRALADAIVAQARAGTPFAELAARYSDDAATRTTGGDLGPLKPGVLAQAIEDVALGVDVGGISAPFNHGTHIVILRIAERDASSLPPLEQAHDRIASDVFGERLQKARRQWLDELKRGIHVDVRM
jgi:peptidyl-prolyl cis-trans isomerase SurA